MVESETKRRTAEQIGRDHAQYLRHPAVAENVEFLRASGDQLRQMRNVVAPLARTLATRFAARRRRSHAGQIDLRKTLRKSMSTGGVPIDVVLKKPHPARPELVVLCDVSGSVAGFSHFTLMCWCMRCASSSRGCASSPSSTPPTRSELSGRARRSGRRGAEDHPRGGRLHPGLGTPTTATPSSRSWTSGPTRCRPARPCWCSATVATTTATRRPTCWRTWWALAATRTGSTPSPSTWWGSGDSATAKYQDVITMHECRVGQAVAPAAIDNLLPV